MKGSFSLTHFFPLKIARAKPNLTTLPYNKIRTISMQHLKSQPLRGSGSRINQSVKGQPGLSKFQHNQSYAKRPYLQGRKKTQSKTNYPLSYLLLQYLQYILRKRRISLSYDHKTVRDIVDLTNRFSDIISPYLELTFH